MKKPSVEKLIKTKARNLQISRCYMNTDWQDFGTAYVLIVREHPQRTFTYATYTLDTWCIGLSASSFGYNVSAVALDEVLQQYKVESTDYATAHNLIYRAIEYADSLGLKPHESWALTQHVLERDAEIAGRALVFGRDGRPHYTPSPEVTKSIFEATLSQLDATIGKGQYAYTQPDSFPDERKEAEMRAKAKANVGGREDDHEQFDHKNPFIEASFTKKEVREIKQGKRKPTKWQAFTLTTSPYLHELQSQLDQCAVDVDRIWDIRDQYVDDDLIYCIDSELEDEMRAFISDSKNAEIISSRNITKIEALRQMNPGIPFLYYTLYMCYMMDAPGPIPALLAEASIHIPDFIYLDLFIAYTNLLREKGESSLDQFNGSYYLTEAFPHRSTFAIEEYLMFQCVLALYFFRRGDQLSAVICASLIAEYADEELNVSVVLTLISEPIAKKAHDI